MRRETSNEKCDEFAKTCSSLSEEGLCKSEETVRVEKWLHAAERSINVLEDKMKQAYEELCSLGNEHDGLWTILVKIARHGPAPK